MKLLLKPYWLFLCVTFPQLVLFWIFFRVFNTIGSQLTPENIRAWGLFGAALGVLWLGATGYGVFALIKKKALHSAAGFPVLAGYNAYLYLFLWHSREVVPWSIPDWMFFGIQPEIYMLTFLMPALSYGLMLLVVRYLPQKDGYAVWKDLIGTAAIPLGWYMIFVVLVPLLHQIIDRFIDARFFVHTAAILFIASSVLFLFLLARLICILLARKPKIWSILKIPAVTVLPLLGLLFNNNGLGGLSPGYSFGDFSHPAFYVFALLTGGLLLLPPLKHKVARLAVFFGKCVCFAYTCYFFIVFLPFLPFSIAAVIAAGLGFLMLTPLVLMFVHVRSLWEDILFLREAFKKYQLALVFAAGVAILPAAVAISYGVDRGSLDGALRYVYEDDYGQTAEASVKPVVAKPAAVRSAALKRTLENIKANREADGRLGRILSGRQTPYLSSFYRWMVLDNLTLSDQKLRELETIFFGHTDIPAPEARQPAGDGEDVEIKSIRTETALSDDGKTTKSWIHFELQNPNHFQGEYSTAFTLPPGCWISNYYLDVAGVRKYGILADKRAALWVYDQITSWRQDPGILYYREDGGIAFRVFPFGSDEVRKTGIEVIHSGDVRLVFDGQEVALHGQSGTEGGGTADSGGVVFSSDGKSAFVPAEVKRTLPAVARKPHYFFIIDFSGMEAGGTADLIKRTAEFMEKQGIKPEGATIAAVNDEVRPFAANPGWEQEIAGISPRGGFFLDRAVRKALLQAEAPERQERPVIVAVSHNMDRAVMLNDFSGFQKAFPGDAAYCELREDGLLYPCQMLSKASGSGSNEPSGKVSDGGSNSASKAAAFIGLPPEKPVLAWPDGANPEAFLPDDGQGSLVLLDPEQDYDAAGLEGATWDNGLVLAAMDRSLDLNPSGHYRKSTAVLKNSFRSGIMSSQTSYIVVENEAQEKALLEKQRQLLASQKSLDAGNAEALMSEPSILYILPVAAALYLLKRNRERRKKQPV